MYNKYFIHVRAFFLLSNTRISTVKIILIRKKSFFTHFKQILDFYKWYFIKILRKSKLFILLDANPMFLICLGYVCKLSSVLNYKSNYKIYRAFIYFKSGLLLIFILWFDLTSLTSLGQLWKGRITWFWAIFNFKVVKRFPKKRILAKLVQISDLFAIVS